MLYLDDVRSHMTRPERQPSSDPDSCVCRTHSACSCPPGQCKCTNCPGKQSSSDSSCACTSSGYVPSLSAPLVKALTKASAFVQLVLVRQGQLQVRQLQVRQVRQLDGACSDLLLL